MKVFVCQEKGWQCNLECYDHVFGNVSVYGYIVEDGTAIFTYKCPKFHPLTGEALEFSNDRRKIKKINGDNFNG